MLPSDLEHIASFIKQSNKYFTTAYPLAYTAETGHVHNNEKVVFPLDNKGNYFYLRLPKPSTFSYDTRYNVSDCNKGVGMKTEVVLVAYVKNGDSSKLLKNMVTTMKAYSEVDISLKSATANPMEVIMQEMSKTKPEDKATAMKTFKNAALVSLTFEATRYMLDGLSCITEPCKNC